MPERKAAMEDGAGDGLPSGLTAEVRALIEMMARGGIADLTLETAAVKLHLRAHGSGSHYVPGGASPAGVAADQALPGDDGTFVITAPMIGTFYVAPAPGEPPFVDVGDTVEAGQTIGIIEAMKIMNEIPAEQAGTVLEFLVANGQPVEYGQPLLRLAPAGA